MGTVVWEFKIVGEGNALTADNNDALREAAERAFTNLTGHPAYFSDSSVGTESDLSQGEAKTLEGVQNSAAAQAEAAITPSPVTDEQGEEVDPEAVLRDPVTVEPSEDVPEVIVQPTPPGDVVNEDEAVVQEKSGAEADTGELQDEDAIPVEAVDVESGEPLTDTLDAKVEAAEPSEDIPAEPVVEPTGELPVTQEDVDAFAAEQAGGDTPVEDPALDTEDHSA